MRIAVFTLYYLPHQGGAVSRLDSCMRGNDEMRFIVYVPEASAGGGIENPVLSEEPPANVEVRRVPVVARRGLRAVSYAVSVSLLKLRELKREGFDVFHCVSPPILTALPARLAAGSWNKVLLDIGDPWVETLLIGRFIRHGWLEKVLRRLETQIVKRAGHVVTCSPFISEMYKGLNAKIDTILTSFDLSATGEEGPGNRNAIVYFGHLGPLYNLKPAIEAMRYLPEELAETHLEIIGTGPDEAALRRFAAEQGVDSRVTFTGAMSRPEVFEALSEARLSIVPISESEEHDYTVPIKLLESMAFAKPVIGWGAKGVEHIIRESDAGIYLANPVPQLVAEAIEQIMRDDASYQRFSDNARAFAMRELDISSAQDRLNEAYRDLMGGSS